MSWDLEAGKVPVTQQAECPGRGSRRGRAHFEEVKECCISRGSEPWEGLEESLGGRGDRCFWNSHDHARAAEGTKGFCLDQGTHGDALWV